MKKFHGLVLTAVLTSLIIPFSLAASAETNENGNNATPTEEKTTDTTKNIMTEKKTEPAEPAEPTKDTTVTPPQKSKVQTTIDITDSQEVYSYEQNSKINLKDFTETLTKYTDTKLTNYRLAANSKLSTAQTGIQEVTLLGENEDGKTTAVKLNYLVKEKTAQLTITDMNFDLETKIFTGKTKPFASVYMSSPVDENFGEGTTTADKDGHFYAEWATTPKQITAYAFDEDGNFSEEVTYQVPAKKQNEAVVTAPEKIKKIETKNAVKSATAKPTDVAKVTKDDKTDLPSTGDKGAEWIFVVAGVIVILVAVLLLRKRKK
ncbi:LPXTG cell wall anchor domain-containing protein [Listeria monocytogenes]|nr:LPXTG cell wall anchor domain-containing protein [Listeria monocytogenes]EJH4943842.1 LPXTG cell wall anchor domain-containing protein [Listeria monocytogenes]EJH4972794.1 LPXTG cell wall anchor domain-containing protein [Listeria monocytogenes]EJH5059053.1 LPXTG cell wall anchor domain-containing protein [Listeria monocytogenes]